MEKKLSLFHSKHFLSTPFCHSAICLFLPQYWMCSIKSECVLKIKKACQTFYICPCFYFSLLSFPAVGLYLSQRWDSGLCINSILSIQHLRDRVTLSGLKESHGEMWGQRVKVRLWVAALKDLTGILKSFSYDPSAAAKQMCVFNWISWPTLLCFTKSWLTSLSLTGSIP